MTFLQFIRYILSDIKKYYLLTYKYKNAYKTGYFESIVPSRFFEVEGLQIDANVTIKNPAINMGGYTYIGHNTFIDKCKSIGKFCSISFGVKIGLINHAQDHISTNPYFYRKSKGWAKQDTFDENAKGMVEIGNDVLISANVVILEGVTIGHGAIIAAGAVVHKDVPPYAIVGGVPAKVIKYRFSEDLITKLVASEWWNLPLEEIKRRSDFFPFPDKFLNNL